MGHWIKSKLLSRKLDRLVKKVGEYCKDDDRLAMLNYEMMDLESLCYDIYNEVLLCPFYTNELKKATYKKVKVITNCMNEYRFREGLAM